MAHKCWSLKGDMNDPWIQSLTTEGASLLLLTVRN